MPFPPGFIEELKARNPVERVISQYVELKRAGSNLVGLCPFHSERSPSFTVFEDHFHCFGCGAGGDAITFVMRMDNLQYREAVQLLADRSGMTVPEDRSAPFQVKTALTRERSFEMNRIAARVFYDNLMSDAGKHARAYLAERQLSRATCVRFGLGYAKDSFTDLTDTLVAKGFSVDEIRENFLCGLSRKNGRPFDMFRNRVIFPIIDTVGNVIAFGGRVMDDSKPKYLNSSDTVVFKKSRNLFALNFAKNVVLGDSKNAGSGLQSYAKPGELIVCEGYMDVIAMHQAGFGNAVATLGTAITSEHARLISRYAKTVYLAYDSDSAGQTATSRAIGMLSEVGIDAKVLKIEGAKDPDEYIKSYGAAAFAKILGASEGQIDFKLNSILKKYDLNNADDKLNAVREVCRMLAGIRSDVKRDVYAARLVTLTGVKAESIDAEIKYAMRSENRKIRKKHDEELQKNMYGYRNSVNPEALTHPKAALAEQRILGIVMLYPEQLDGCDLTEDDFVTAFDRTLFTHIKRLYESGESDFSALNEFYEPEQYAYILEMRRSRLALTANGRDALNEQISVLRELKAAKNAGDAHPEESLTDAIRRIREQKLPKDPKTGNGL